MSHAEPQDEPVELVVDTAELAEELQRRGLRGVHVGDRVRLELVHGARGGDRPSWPPTWVSSFHSGRSDLGRRAKEIVRAELGRHP